MFSIEIQGNENYYVTEDGILVHNGYGDANELKKIEDRGFNGVEVTPNGGLNYANSDALYLVKDGQKNIITINYSGVSHIGGCSQYKEATGNSYTFKTW